MIPPLQQEVASRVGESRLPRYGAEPTVSVVVASNRSAGLLHACLESLLPQCQRVGAELIVVRAGDEAEIAHVLRGYPSVRVLYAPARSTIPELRGAGMTAALGDIVALTEDHCVVSSRWIETLVRSAAEGADVVGGGMDNARRDRTVDWAAYFSEYGFFATTRPTSEGPPLLTGANVAYTRSIVDTVAASAREGEWENVAHDRLGSDGRVLRFISTAAVYQNKSYQFWDFCRDRYEHGRDYARKRLSEQQDASRWLLLASSPALPFLLTTRVARAAASTRWPTFLRALPATFAFLTAWSFGEAVGYLRGRAVGLTTTETN